MGRVKILGKKIEKSASRTFKAGLRKILPKPSVLTTPLDPNTVRRILVVRQDSRLGNLLLLTPLLHGLRMIFPQATVDVLLSDVYADVYRHNPYINQIFILPKKIILPNPAKPWQLLIALRRKKYDLAFDASHMHAFSLTSAVITALVGAERSIGYDRGDAARFLNTPIPPLVLPRHETEVLLNLAHAALPQAHSQQPIDLKPEYFLTPDERQEGRRLWTTWGGDRNTVALMIGGRGIKRWPLEQFIELARTLTGQNRRVVVFAGPAEKSLLAKLTLPSGAHLAPSLPLRMFAAALAQAQTAVVSDSGPMHLAVALNVPTVEIFLESDCRKFGYGHLPHHRAIDAVGRLPSVSEVMTRLLEIL